MDEEARWRFEELERERDPTAKVNRDHVVAEHEDGTVVELYKIEDGRDIYRIINGGFVAMCFKDNKNLYINNIQHMAADWALLKLGDK